MAITFRVRVAWTTDPFSASPTWTDESGRTDVGGSSITITRGAGDLDSSVNPSTLSVTFDNHDGRFTPGYTGSALYPNVVRGKRIRVDATVDGTNYFNRFDGFLDTLPVQWSPTGRYAEAQVTAVDRLAQLGHQLVPNDIVSTTIAAQTKGAVPTGPADYWKFSDPAGSTVPVNFGQAVYGGGVADGLTQLTAHTQAADTSAVVDFGSATGPGTDGLTAVQVTDGAFVGVGRTYSDGHQGFVGFFRVDTLDPTFGIVSLLTLTDGQYQVLNLSVNSAGLLSLFVGATLSRQVTITSTTSVNDGATHMFGVDVLTDIFSTMTLTLYLDGVAVATDSSVVAAGSAPVWSITYAAQSANWQSISIASVVMAHLAAFGFAATDGLDYASISNAGLNGFSGETSAVRFTRIAAMAGITPVVTGTSGTQSMGPLSNVQGMSILDLLQQVQDTENGAFFTQTDGSIRLVPRRTFDNMAASMTLTNGQYGTDLEFMVDNSRLVNDAIGTGPTGIPQEAINATSVTANGTYTSSRTINSTNDAEVLGWAQGRVAIDYTMPRVSQVTLDLMTQQSLCTTAWALEIGNRLDLSGLPSTAPASSIKLQIDGYTESYQMGSDTSPGSYTITFNTSPDPTSQLTGTGFWKLGDATLGKLGSSTTLAY